MTHHVHHGRFAHRMLASLVAVVAIALCGAHDAWGANGVFTEILCSNPDTGQGTGLLPPELAISRNSLIGADYPTMSSCSGAMTSAKGLVLASGFTTHYSDAQFGALRYDAPAGLSLLGASYFRHFYSAWGNASRFTVTEHGATDPGDFFGQPRGDTFYWYGTNGGGDGTAVTTGSTIDLYGAANVATVAIGGDARWTVTAACDSAGRGGCDVSQLDVTYRIFGGKATLYDAYDPQASGPASGGLVTEAPLRGVQDLTFGAEDVGSGVYRVRLLVDDAPLLAQVVDSNNGRCRDVNAANADAYEFPVAQPCKPSAGGTFDFDTRTLPEGTHSLKVQVEDAGGNTTTIVSRSVAIDNVPPPVNTSLPEIAGQAREESGLAGSEGTWSSGAPLTLAYQWQRCAADGQGCADIAGSTGRTHALRSADVGHRVQLRVRATSSEGATDAYSAPTVVVTTSAGTSAEIDGTTFQPGAPNGRNASASAVLSAHDSHGARRVLYVRYGHRVAIVGSLMTPAGLPIAGARLDVSTQLRLGGAPLRRAGEVVTDARGRFRYVAPVGASRMLRFGYRTRIGVGAFARTTDVLLRVRAAVRFSVSRRQLRNGHSLRYLGRVLGPKTGHKFVEVQVRNGRRWQIVCSVRSDAHGEFGCAHRFTRTFSRTVYRFRARIRRQSMLPYEPGNSRSVKVLVRP